jgi:hypothetical protein
MIYKDMRLRGVPKGVLQRQRLRDAAVLFVG